MLPLITISLSTVLSTKPFVPGHKVYGFDTGFADSFQGNSVKN